jgi:hypothetical protein
VYTTTAYQELEVVTKWLWIPNVKNWICFDVFDHAFSKWSHPNHDDATLKLFQLITMLSIKSLLFKGL